MKKHQKGKYVNGDMIQDSIVIKNTAIDEIKMLMESGNIDSAIKLLEKQEDFMGTYHAFYPDYTIGLKQIDNKMVPYSKPLSKEAIIKRPPNIIGKLRFAGDLKNFNCINDIFEYSYNTQTDIDVNIIELKKMLGDDEDPYQHEIKKLCERCQWKIKHKEFPPAKPYKIFLSDDGISFDYILLRIIKIQNDKVYLSNQHQQEIDIIFEFVFDLQNSSMSVKFSISESYKNNHNSFLKFLLLIKGALQHKSIHIKSLEDRVELARGKIDGYNYSSPFGNIDDEIKFIQSIIIIERKYKKKIIIPNKFDSESYENILYLATGINEGKVENTWKKYNLYMKISDTIHRKLRELDKPLSISLRYFNLKIFDEEYKVTIIRTFKQAKIEDIDKLKRMLSVLEVGDDIMVTVVPGEDNTCIDEFVFS